MKRKRTNELHGVPLNRIGCTWLLPEAKGRDMFEISDGCGEIARRKVGGISVDAISLYFRIIVTVKVEHRCFPRVVRIGIIRRLQ
jgi:hypothetical protein